MSDRDNPFKRAGFPEYAGFHLMPFGWKERAATHEVNRQRVVASLLLDIHIMAVLDIIGKGKTVSLKKPKKVKAVGAVVQNLEGSENDGTEAAHCAPRQIVINSVPVQNLLKRKFPDRAWAMEVLFGETDILPENYNKADSRAERNGLAQGLGEACEIAIFKGHFGGKMEVDAILSAALYAYSTYQNRAKNAFQQSEDRLKEKLKPAGLKHREKVNLNEQLHIMRQYAETLLTAEGRDKGLAYPKVEGLVKIYNMFAT